MYRVFRASTLYYENYMKNEKYRYDIIKPFMLLTSTIDFRDAKQNKSKDFIDLCNIILQMQYLINYKNQNDKYHHFISFLKEIEILGFKFNKSNFEDLPEYDNNILLDQIDLLHQFFAFRYPFDEFDNKSGSYDIENKKFIFIQP